MKLRCHGLQVLIVEDDRRLADSLGYLLASEGAEVTIASTVDSARSHLTSDVLWDLVLLDIKLPDGDGFDVLDVISQKGLKRTAIVAVSGNLQEPKRALRLQASRAVLLPKPFEAGDLLAAIEGAMLLTASEPSTSPLGGRSGTYPVRLSFGPISLQLIRQSVAVQGEPIDLRPTQFRILAQLLSNPGKALTVAELVDTALRGFHGDGSANIRFQIHGLRRKLGAAGRLIETASGGYGVGLERVRNSPEDEPPLTNANDELYEADGTD
ncbi:MAG: response regulator transcription factor [Myxococcales bacterium]